MLQSAEDHRQSLLELDPFNSLLGKLAHAVLGIPQLWEDFITLVQGMTMQARQYRVFVQLTPVMRRAMVAAREKLQSKEGLPFTSYRLRPGEDKLPIWISFTDASRRMQRMARR